MKNLLLTGILGVALSVASCSANKTSGVSTAKQAQTQRAEFLKMKGTWQISSVDYDKGYKIKPFDEGADAQCWVGSQWKLVPNNYTGSYVLSGGGTCPSVSQPIGIDMQQDHQFMFKKLQQGTKAKTVLSGYALQLTNQSADQFSLKQNVPFEGNAITVTYNFQRTGK